MTTRRKTAKLRADIETHLGVLITQRRSYAHGGLSRYGWYALHPCHDTYLGRTLADAAVAVGLASAEQVEQVQA